MSGTENTICKIEPSAPEQMANAEDGLKSMHRGAVTGIRCRRKHWMAFLSIRYQGIGGCACDLYRLKGRGQQDDVHHVDVCLRHKWLT